MHERAFRVGSWIALVAAVAAAVGAAVVLVIGSLAMAGAVSYPVNLSIGPVSIKHELSTPVALHAPICQSADVRTAGDAPSDCLPFFLRSEAADDGGGPVRTQDGDLRPVVANLHGSVSIATEDGGRRLIALTTARDAVGLAGVAVILFLLWRLLANAAAGRAFSVRSAAYVRTIGLLLIAGSVAGSVVAIFMNVVQLGYSVQAFGAGPFLEPAGQEDVDVGQIAFGVLVLLLAEVFRRGASVEAEQRLTV